MLNLEYATATAAYLSALRAYVDFCDQNAGLIAALPGQFSFAQAVMGASVKTAYQMALFNSLVEIDAWASVGRAGYRPGYLAGAHELLADVSTPNIEDGAAATLADRVQSYANLYNDGIWQNISLFARRREVGNYVRRFNSAFLALLQEQKRTLGPGPIPDSNVWGRIPAGGGMILAQPTPRSATLNAISIRLYNGNYPPGSFQALVYSRSGSQFTLQGVSNIAVDFTNFDEQFAKLSNPLPVSAGQYIGIRNSGPDHLYVNWVDGPDHHVFWPGVVADAVGSQTTFQEPGVSMTYCGWSAVF